LVDRRHHGRALKQSFQMVGVEVADPDGADSPIRQQLFGGLVFSQGLFECPRHRPVQQVQVEVVEPELAHAGVEGAQRLVVGQIRDLELGGDKQIGARDPAPGDGLADLFLIAVAGRGVDQPVPDRDGGAHRSGRLVGSNRESAEARVGMPAGLIETALSLELEAGEVIADTVGGARCVFLAGLYRAERAIAERISALARGPTPWQEVDPEKAIPWVEGRTGLALAPLADRFRAAGQLPLPPYAQVLTCGCGGMYSWNVRLE
jgi:hypothetical protein